MDVACPFDTRVQDKEREKVEKHQDLKRELKRIWQSQEIATIPIIIGTLGTVGKNFEHWLRKLDIMAQNRNKGRRATPVGSFDLFATRFQTRLATENNGCLLKLVFINEV